MKCLFVLALFSAPMVCSVRHPDSAVIYCLKDNCKTFELDNKLSIEVTNVYFNYSKKTSGVTIFCSLKNLNNSGLEFNRANFTISSSKTKYFAGLFQYAEGWKLKTKADTFTLAPSEKLEYAFSFNSKQKISFEEYEELMKTDSVVFEYSTAAGGEKLFGLIGKVNYVQGYF